MHVNVIDWHIHFLRVDRWLELWHPTVERALAYGASACTLTRSEDDPHHFRQTSVWEDRLDFDRYWQGEELTELRGQISGMHNVLLLPHWHSLVMETGARLPATG